MKTIEELKLKVRAILDEQLDMLDTCEDEDRELTKAEVRKYEKMERKVKYLTSEIEIREMNNGKSSAELHQAMLPQLHGSANSLGELRNNFGEEDREEYVEAFNRYLVSGKDALSTNEFRMMEDRALQADLDTQGGFLTPKQFTNQLIQKLDDLVVVRQRANVIRLGVGESLSAPLLDTDPADPTWDAEIRTGTEDSDMKFGKYEFTPHPLAKRIKVSKRLLRISSVNVGSLVNNRLAYKFAITQENAYMLGSGVNQPLGLFVASDMGIDSGRDNETAVAATVGGDDLHDTVGDLKAQYRRGAVWLVSREFENRVRKLKDGEGNYLLQQGLAAGQPNRLLGYPLVVSEYVPDTWSSGEYVGLFGDLSFYWIVDQMNFQVQVLIELYAATNQNGYLGRYEGDAAPVISEAFVRIKLK